MQYVTIPVEVLHKINRAGAKGQRFVQWIPPKTGSDDPNGILIFETLRNKTGSNEVWT